MSVDNILKRKGHQLFTIRPEHSVGEAATLMADKKVGALVVCDTKGRIAGMLSERDVVSALARYAKGAYEMPVRNVMSSPVVTCESRDSVKRISETMNERHIRHLPVVDGDELIGIISIRDLVDHRLREAQMEVGVLRDFAVTR